MESIAPVLKRDLWSGKSGSEVDLNCLFRVLQGRNWFPQSYGVFTERGGRLARVQIPL